MSVRKRTWTTGKGVEKEAWVVDYTDSKGVRRLKTFDRKKEADNFAATAHVEVREGLHVADSASATIREAGKLWIAARERAGREQATVAQYKQHLDLHITPFIGDTRLNALNVPAVRSFEDQLRDEGRSDAMVRKVLVSLGSLLADANERGLCTRNAVRDMRGRRGPADTRQSKRRKAKLRVGVDIPTPEEIRTLCGFLSGKQRPLMLTAIFTGLRASELRGLPWAAIDFDKSELRVYQRADRYNKIGRPKSEAGERTVPMPAIVTNALREWKLKCPRRDTGKVDEAGEPIRVLDLVFPNGQGNVESLGNIINRALIPVQLKAGITVDTGKVDDEGKPVLTAKYTGMHALRHFYASWCINSREDGGLGLQPKTVQERLGHSSIVMTMDVYGHLFPKAEGNDEMTAAANALLG